MMSEKRDLSRGVLPLLAVAFGSTRASFSRYSTSLNPKIELKRQTF